MDGDSLVASDRRQDAVHSDGHVGQSKRIVQIVERGGKEAPGAVEISESADAQQPSRYRRNAQLACDDVRVSFVAPTGFPDSLGSHDSLMPMFPITRNFR